MSILIVIQGLLVRQSAKRGGGSLGEGGWFVGVGLINAEARIPHPKAPL